MTPPRALVDSVQELHRHADWFRVPGTAPEPGPFVIVVDDFHDEPDAIRELALAQEFVQYLPPLIEQVGAEVAAQYPIAPAWFATALLKHRGRAVNHPVHGFRHAPESLRWRFEALLGEEVCADSWHDLGDGWNGAFHLINRNIEGRHVSIHHHCKEGDVHPRGWSGLVYLSPDPAPDSGTSIWRDKATGLCISAPGIAFHRGQDAERFELALRIENRYNRLVLFRERVLHRAGRGFGSGREDARLTQTFFFRSDEK